LRKGANEMKYKVGDKVKVRSDLEIGKKYGKHVYVKPMDNLKGRTVTIMVFGGYGYRIEESGYTWTDEMFEEVENKMIKIKKWEDLHGIENEKYQIRKAHSCIGIDLKNSEFTNVAVISSEELENNAILSVLKLFGFDVEFQEEPTLTEEEFCFLSCFLYAEDKTIATINGITYLESQTLQALKNGMFSFIKERETWKVKDLLKLKRKGE
jgi:hypothetical protein